jgi:hypothetical protein
MSCAFYNVILVHSADHVHNVLFFIESKIIKYTFTCFTFQTNIITVDLEYIDIFPYSTLIKQHQLCLSNFIHVYITINLFNLCQHFRISMNCQRFSSNKLVSLHTSPFFFIKMIFGLMLSTKLFYVKIIFYLYITKL